MTEPTTARDDNSILGAILEEGAIEETIEEGGAEDEADITTEATANE